MLHVLKSKSDFTDISDILHILYIIILMQGVLKVVLLESYKVRTKYHIFVNTQLEMVHFVLIRITFVHRALIQ